VSILLEGDRICLKEEVEKTIDEHHVKSDEYQNRFLGEHDEGLDEVCLHESAKVGLGLVGFGMDGPILLFEAEILRSLLEDLEVRGFGHDDVPYYAKEKTHNHRYPGRPPPAKV